MSYSADFVRECDHNAAQHLGILASWHFLEAQFVGSLSGFLR